MFYVQAAIDDHAQRINLMTGATVPELSAFAETFFINNNYKEVRIITHGGRIATDYSNPDKPFECLWRKPN